MRTVSVAMTTCNGAAFAAAQIQSLIAQTMPAAEIIVCDDASDDGTLQQLEDYERLGLLKLYKNTSRLGIIANFKRAVSLCSPEHYIALCDQDDVWLPHKIETDVIKLAEIDLVARPALVFSDALLTDAGLQPTEASFWDVLGINPDYENLTTLLFGNIVTGCTVIMNPAMRDIFLEMPETGLTMHDAWIGLAAYSFGDNAHIAEPLVQYRQHGGNVTYTANQRSTILDKIQRNIKQLSNNRLYFKEEIAMAAAFLAQYSERLTADQRSIFESFIALKNKSYWQKKKAAIQARAYRKNINRQ